jgi:hypothetical protein
MTALSRVDWQATHVRTPGSASRRFLGIGSPQSSHSSALSPVGVSAGAKNRVLHGVVDLVLNRAVARPTAGHDSLLLRGTTIVIPDLIRDPLCSCPCKEGGPRLKAGVTIRASLVALRKA